MTWMTAGIKKKIAPTRPEKDVIIQTGGARDIPERGDGGKVETQGQRVPIVSDEPGRFKERHQGGSR